MVAGKWGWGMLHMIDHFGYKALVAVVISTLLFAFAFKKELTGKLEVKDTTSGLKHPPVWLTIFHLIFLALVVYTAHHMVFFLGLFLFFLGFVSITGEFQDTAKLKESLLVGFFLAGLVTLGGVQGWWLQEVLSKLGDLAIFFGATALTAITDNAALTYLGSLVPLSDGAKYNLVAGAVTGGGLTVIANAPNPAGFGILKGSFGKEGIKPLNLFLGALIPTFIVIVCMQVLPNLGPATQKAPTAIEHSHH
jgi:predicted cation transporter